MLIILRALHAKRWWLSSKIALVEGECARSKNSTYKWSNVKQSWCSEEKGLYGYKWAPYEIYSDVSSCSSSGESLFWYRCKKRNDLRNLVVSINWEGISVGRTKQTLGALGEFHSLFGSHIPWNSKMTVQLMRFHFLFSYPNHKITGKSTHGPFHWGTFATRVLFFHSIVMFCRLLSLWRDHQTIEIWCGHEIEL